MHQTVILATPPPLSLSLSLVVATAIIGVIAPARSGRLTPSKAAADQAACGKPCTLQSDPWFPGDYAWSIFEVRPRLHVTPPAAPTPTPAPSYLMWDGHGNDMWPPAVVQVSWAGHVELMEILPDGTTAGTHPNIRLHKVNADSCDYEDSLMSRTLVPADPCIERVKYDVDWRRQYNQNEWDWIYFWVRDPDFVAMKAVDPTDCETGEWPYEYVNAGPKYSICQDFGVVYDSAHGVSGVTVRYDVLYEPGAPPSPTTGPTTTPPPGKTPTP